MNIHERLEIGIVHPGIYPEAAADSGLLLQSITHILADSYFDRIEIGPICDTQMRQSLGTLLRAAKVNVTYLAQPLIFANQLNLQHSTLAERSRALAALDAFMEDAAMLGADSIALISGPEIEPEEEEACLERLADSLIKLSALASTYPLQIYLELFDTSIDKKRMIGSISRTERLMHIIGSAAPSMSLLLDLSHFPLLGESIEHTVQRLSPWIGHVHIGNCCLKEDDVRYGDKHPYFGYKNGCNDTEQVADLLRALHQSGYITDGGRTKLSFETMRAAGEDADVLMVNAKRTLQAAWRQFSSEGATKA